MRVLDPLLSAWRSVVAHKLRSFLTTLGIVIGVAAVIGLLAIGQGAQNEIIANIESLGANLVQITPRTGAGGSPTLSVEDARAIEAQVANVKTVAPVVRATHQVVADGQDTIAISIGTTPSYLLAYNLEVASGSFFSDYDVARSARVAVLGSNTAEDLFGDANPVGQEIKMGGTVVRIIGVLKPKGAAIMSPDDYVILPLAFMQQFTTQQRTAQGEHVVHSIALSVGDAQYSAQVVAETTDLLRERHRLLPDADDDFQILSTDDIAAQVSEAMGIMTIFLGAIAAISLLVGGIGVMNIMLVSVLERTREIGIRKALGARERDIWTQFLIEAALLTLTGGAIGIAFGYGIAAGVGYFVQEITPVVTPDVVILAATVSVSIGLFFGFYPAWQASRLNPIDALRAD